ncbi:benzoate 4-monooxygenase cytochrome P450 [Ophiocordyceps camponoti-floridani]|uniref:Benzoate 4-monooxygenase cytochrome P450 n=1 Tax=Ophiocordyceps camponoti-floridani TaxID=2030778 RepID=A0A8H4Q1Y4_9HYPO|nr:benzoate 4-monooxygenase cytochrome P450 [Ophiocordyceps camponoti-floridani]
MMSLLECFGLVLLHLALPLTAWILYNIYLHPLSHVPGPFWDRATGIPSWYATIKGRRHVYLSRQFDLYGDRIRPEPGTVLFRGPAAHADIYGARSNVRRSCFYRAFNRTKKIDETTFTTTDVAAHARKRRVLNVCFTERLVKAAAPFIVRHVDRFGRSFDIKEGGENSVKEVPDCISSALQFYYPICRSPFLKPFVWLKPRGLDRALQMISPPTVHKYNDFVCSSVADRLALQKEQASRPEAERRQDMFYFLADARHADTGKAAYGEDELRAECSVLITAGSGTTSVSLSGVFFYLTGDEMRYKKLVDEVRSSFASLDHVVYGPDLLGCRYLRACVDEGMRLTPAGASEHPREVLKGGIRIANEFYPAGTIVGTVPWADSRNAEIYGDADTFRPERWIVDEEKGTTKEQVSRLKANFHPFLTINIDVP